MVEDISRFIKFYADEKCTIPLDSIIWNAGLKLKLITGEEVKLKNMAVAGQTVTAILYMRNEGKYRFAITNIILDDKRIKIRINNGWLIPNVPVRLTLTFGMPSTTVPKYVIKKGEINIKGYYMIGV